MKYNALILLLVAVILGMFKEVAAQRPVQRRNNYGNPDTTIKNNNNEHNKIIRGHNYLFPQPDL